MSRQGVLGRNRASLLYVATWFFLVATGQVVLGVPVAIEQFCVTIEFPHGQNSHVAIVGHSVMWQPGRGINDSTLGAHTTGLGARGDGAALHDRADHAHSACARARTTG